MVKKNTFIDELKSVRSDKIDVVKEIVDKIFDEIIIAVKYYNNLDKTKCIEEVPYMIMGYPPYEIDIVVKKVVSRLKKMNFKTSLISKNKILISWS